MKSDLSLGDLKTNKNMKKILKKTALKKNSIFSIVNFPIRSELFFLSPFVYYERNIDSFCGVKSSY